MNKEDQLQMACADYLRLQYPRVLWCHIANERQTSPARGAKLKRKGVRKGMPDILIFERIEFPGNCAYPGMAIELKVKPNKPTIEQIDVLARLNLDGWATAVCYTFDEFKTITDNYLG